MKRLTIILLMLVLAISLIGQEIENIEVSISNLMIDITVDGDIFWISVSTSQINEEWEFRAFDFFLSYDSNIITFLDVSISGTLANHGSVGANLYVPGVLGVMWFSSLPLVGEGSIVNIQFQAIDNGIVLFDIANFYYYIGAPSIEVTNINQGEVIITGFPIIQVDNPIFEPLPGSYPDPQLVTVSTETVEAEIYYTFNGDDPDDNSILYTGPFFIDEDVVIKARGYKPGYIPSDISTGIYLITQTLSPPDNIILTVNDNELILSWDVITEANLYYIFGTENPHTDDWMLLAEIREGTVWNSPIYYPRFFFRIVAAVE